MKPGPLIKGAVIKVDAEPPMDGNWRPRYQQPMGMDIDEAIHTTRIAQDGTDAGKGGLSGPMPPVSPLARLVSSTPDVPAHLKPSPKTARVFMEQSRLRAMRQIFKHPLGSHAFRDALKVTFQRKAG